MKSRQLKNKLNHQIFLEDIRNGCFVYHSFFNLHHTRRVKNSCMTLDVVHSKYDVKKFLAYSKNPLEHIKKTERIVAFFDQSVIISNHYAWAKICKAQMIIYTKIYLSITKSFLLYLLLKQANF